MKIGALKTVVIALSLIGIMFSAPRIASANSKSSFLETIGISVAVGTVLGASTLPFYDQPGKHLVNAAYGASAGAVVGIGILAYGLIAGPSNDGFDDYAMTSRGDFLPKRTALGRASSTISSRRFATARALASHTTTVSLPTPHAQLWLPVVSLTW
jgi:hypothetical protein